MRKLGNVVRSAKTPYSRVPVSNIARGISLPAPTEGWDTSSPLAEMPPKRAYVLDNFFPQPDWVELRNGRQLHRPTGETTGVETLMYWQGPIGQNLFAACADKIFDVTASGLAPAVAVVTGLSNSRWQWINFTTPGGSFLWACNGVDDPRIFNGSTWNTAAITGISASDAINVTAHKGRIWVVLRESTKAAYLPVGSIQGAATSFEVGGLFTRGGHLAAIGTWSVDGGEGPDDLLVFLSSRGQAVIYKGTDPASAASWAIVGVFDVGTPLGMRCMRKVGADLAVLTVDGVLPLSQATISDKATTERIALTRRIQRAMSEAGRLYQDRFGWELTTYPRGTMAILNVPIAEGSAQVQYVMNTLTGAWCRFTGWNANTFIVFQDRLFFGGNDGTIHEADIPGADQGAIFDAEMRTAWQYYGSHGHVKRWTMLRPLIAANSRVDPGLGIDVDFSDSGNVVVQGTVSNITQSLWDNVNWDEANWAGESTFQNDWYSVSGIGQVASIRLKHQVVAPSLEDPTLQDRYNGFMRVNGFDLVYEVGGFL